MTLDSHSFHPRRHSQDVDLPSAWRADSAVFKLIDHLSCYLLQHVAHAILVVKHSKHREALGQFANL